MQSGGEGAGQEKLEALPVFSQKIQARVKRGNQKGKRREQSTRTSQRTREEKREQIKKKGGGERRW